AGGRAARGVRVTERSWTRSPGRALDGPSSSPRPPPFNGRAVLDRPSSSPRPPPSSGRAVLDGPACRYCASLDGSAGGAALAEGEPGDVGDPVPVGAKDEVVGSGAAQGVAGAGALRGGGRGVAFADAAAEDDLVDGSGLGVGHLDEADVGEVEFAGVDDLDGEHLVAGGEAAQGPFPVGLAVGG